MGMFNCDDWSSRLIHGTKIAGFNFEQTLINSKLNSRTTDFFYRSRRPSNFLLWHSNVPKYLQDLSDAKGFTLVVFSNQVNKRIGN